MHGHRSLVCLVSLGLAIAGCSNPPSEPQTSADPTTADTPVADGARGGACGSLTSGPHAGYLVHCDNPDDKCSIPAGSMRGTCTACPGGSCDSPASGSPTMPPYCPPKTCRCPDGSCTADCCPPADSCASLSNGSYCGPGAFADRKIVCLGNTVYSSDLCGAGCQQTASDMASCN
jgi:hypothetical protein